MIYLVPDIDHHCRCNGALAIKTARQRRHCGRQCYRWTRFTICCGGTISTRYPVSIKTAVSTVHCHTYNALLLKKINTIYGATALSSVIAITAAMSARHVVNSTPPTHPPTHPAAFSVHRFRRCPALTTPCPSRPPPLFCAVSRPQGSRYIELFTSSPEEMSRYANSKR